ncbi:MAG: hypothetical protein M1836_003417 [Candelina mexicana]|nr:MAG: hypothetical protein M1836_003417 [Candelina mexicana]
MPVTSSPHSTRSLSTISSTSSGSSTKIPCTSEVLLPTLPEPAVQKQVHARNRYAHISAPPSLGYYYNNTPFRPDYVPSHRKHFSLPVDPAITSQQSPLDPTETSPLVSSAGTGSGRSASGSTTYKGDKAGHGCKNFDFSYRNVYITPGAANGMGRARVGNGSGVPAGNCVLM